MSEYIFGKVSAGALRVGGFVPLSLADYPEMLSAVVFCQGCPWRCHYCQNPHLLSLHEEGEVQWSEILKVLKRRQGLLDAVVFSGGEPTAQQGLVKAVREVGELGFKVGLHTGGAGTAVLRQVLPFLAWVGFDIKSNFCSYESVTQNKVSGRLARKSLELVLDSNVSFECRTTFHSELLSRGQLELIITELQRLGVRRFVLQNFREQGCTSQGLKSKHNPSPLRDKQWLTSLTDGFESFEIRGLH